MGIALMEAGLLDDLNIEMPVDRHRVRPMRLNLEKIAADEAARGEISVAPAAGLPPTVPPAWQPSCRRIRLAFRRHSRAISEADAILAWAQHSRAIARALQPPSGEDIHDALSGYFAHTDGGG